MSTGFRWHEMPQDCARGLPAEGYGSNDAVARYAEKARTVGLFDTEAEIIDEYFGESGASVLDIGCGAGRTSGPLANRGFDVVGIDRSEPMIEAARHLHSECEFRVEDVTDLSDADGTYQYALFSNNGLDYLHPESRRIEALCEIRRVLHPDGVFVFSTHNGPYVLPALVSDFDYLRRFYLTNGNLSRVGSPYKKDATEFDLPTYCASPWRNRNHIEECGFDLLEWVTKRETALKYFEKMHHFVVQPTNPR